MPSRLRDTRRFLTIRGSFCIFKILKGINRFFETFIWEISVKRYNLKKKDYLNLFQVLLTQTDSEIDIFEIVCDFGHVYECPCVGRRPCRAL